MSWFTKKTRKSLLASVRKVAFYVAVYYIWMERNKVIFQQVVPDANQIIQRIVVAVRFKLMV